MVPVGGERVNGEGEGGWIYKVNTPCIGAWKYNNETKGGGGRGRMMKVVNLIKIHYKHIHKCHSEISFCTTNV
jgi:hypothetical protein